MSDPGDDGAYHQLIATFGGAPQWCLSGVDTLQDGAYQVVTSLDLVISGAPQTMVTSQEAAVVDGVLTVSDTYSYVVHGLDSPGRSDRVVHRDREWLDEPSAVIPGLDRDGDSAADTRLRHRDLPEHDTYPNDPHTLARQEE